MTAPGWEDVPFPDEEWVAEVADWDGVTTTPAPSAASAPEISDFVRELHAKNTRAFAHWRGTGKANGDTSPRGYDWVTACHVFKAGGTINDAKVAILTRPDGHALRMGAQYVDHTVERARAVTLTPVGSEDDELVVDRVVILESSPPIYVLTVGGREFTVSPAVLAARHKLNVAVLEATNQLPNLPPTKGGKYNAWVNATLSKAERVEMPEDAGTEAGERNDVAAMIEGMPLGETRADLERGAVVVADDGCKLLSHPALFGIVRLNIKDITRGKLAQYLRALGWEPFQAWMEGAQVRTWRK